MTLTKQLNKSIKIFILCSLIIIAFIAGNVLGQSQAKIQWLGWPVYAGPYKGADSGIYSHKPTDEKFVRNDIQIGLREDGIVVWRQIQK